MALPNIDSLDKLIYPIYNKAAEEVMQVYHSNDLGTQAKADNSPVTTADLLSCLLYTSPSPRDRQKSRMPSSA